MNYFLFAQPSFWGGTAQIMDIGNTMFIYNDSPSPAQADYFATRNDWVLVGGDLRYAIREIGAEVNPELLAKAIEEAARSER